MKHNTVCIIISNVNLKNPIRKQIKKRAPSNIIKTKKIPTFPFAKIIRHHSQLLETRPELQYVIIPWMTPHHLRP